MGLVPLSLSETVGAVRLLSRNTAANILLIGHHLLNARQVVGRSAFPRWVGEQFGFSLGDVRRFMRVAQTFASVPKPALERIDPTALYVLADRGAPPAVRTACLEAAGRGQRVTVVGVRSLITAARGTIERPKRGPRADASADRMVAEDDTTSRLVLDALTTLTDGGTVRLGRLPDEEEEDDTARPWVCHVYKDGLPPGPPVVSKDSLASALTLAAGNQPRRACKECGWEGPVFDGFSRKAGNPLGRSFNCRKCETRRVGDAKKLKRGTDTAGTPPVRRPPPDERWHSPAGPPAERRSPRDE